MSCFRECLRLHARWSTAALPTVCSNPPRLLCLQTLQPFLQHLMHYQTCVRLAHHMLARPHRRLDSLAITSTYPMSPWMLMCTKQPCVLHRLAYVHWATTWSALALCMNTLPENVVGRVVFHVFCTGSRSLSIAQHSTIALIHALSPTPSALALDMATCEPRPTQNGALHTECT